LDNGHLASLTGLENLLSIEGNIEIWNNPLLTSIEGIANIGATSIDDLVILGNPSLSTCEVQGICDYLVSPNGVVNIGNNAIGCNNPWEIANACGYLLPCLPYGNYRFYKQTDIDNFGIYSECTELEAGVQISGDDISNLDGLNIITSVMGNLNIGWSYFEPCGNPLLTSLSGLENLTSIGGNLQIVSNENLISLSGLESLTFIGGSLIIGTGWNGWASGGNFSLMSLTGLDNLTFIGGNLIIEDNSNLISLSGLENLTSIDGNLSIGIDLGIFNSGNPSLDNLTGLENLSFIGGSLEIISNDALTSLSGLENLTSIEEDLKIRDNDVLPSLTGLENIEPTSITDLTITNNGELYDCDIWPICQYLQAPGGTVVIEENALECNSIEEVEEHCLTEIEEYLSKDNLNISPNPLESNAVITYTLKENSNVTMEILDLSGRLVVSLVNEIQQQGKQRIEFNTMGLPAGIYFCVLKTNQGIQTKKMIKL